MTAARQERKSRRTLFAAGAISGAIVAATLGSGGPAPGPAVAAVTERVVVNRHTGLAIDGFDPVAYFTDAAPKPGRAGLEVRHAGASWRFANEGNRAAFAAAPDVYAPQFGGHDPMAVARGSAAPGHPLLWAVAGRRLYLFYSEQTLAAFNANPDSAIEAADRHWPDVIRGMPP